MSKSALLLGVALVTLSNATLAEPQTGGIPDFSGSWTRTGDLVETFEAIPGYTGAGPILDDPANPHVDGVADTKFARWVAILDNPILKPETRDRLKTITEFEIKGVSHLKDEGMCQPSGVPMLLNRRGSAIQMLQTKNQVTIINARDHQVRFIYLDRPHTKAPGHDWYGDSVGHYEGDTLVVDTIGENDKTQTDRFGTPHSDQIHVTERFRIAPDRRSMEVQFTVEDPGAFTMPWSARARFVQRKINWQEEVCAENNRFAGSATVGGKIVTSVPMPTADKADF